MTDLIIVIVIAIILTLAIRYIFKQKQAGVDCIGCPASSCGKKCPVVKKK